MHRASLSPASALVAHIEPLLTGSRVLVVGNAESSLAEHLLERGARLVQVLDPEHKRVSPAAAQNTDRRISFAPLTESSLREASFDCALVEDLARATHPQELLQGVRRVLSPQGVALVLCANQEHCSGLLKAQRGDLPFADFSEAVHSTFEQVLLVAQTPFVGYAVVHLHLTEPPVPALDNGFLTGGSDQADYYIALAGRAEALESLQLEDMTIVQLPAESALAAPHPSQRAQEQRALRRIETLETELQELRRVAQQSPAPAPHLAEQVERLTLDLKQRDAWIAEIEARAESADIRADEAEARLEELEAELLSQKAQQRTLEQQLQSQKKRAQQSDELCQKLKRELAEVGQLLAQAEDRLAQAEREQAAQRETLEAEFSARLEKAQAEAQKRSQAELAQREAEARRAQEEQQSRKRRELETELRAQLATLEREIASWEEQLAERGRHVAELEGQLAELERYARTLTAELASGNSAPAAEELTAPLEREIEQLTRTLAEREADLQAASWMISSLSQKLKNFEPSPVLS